MLRCLEHVSRGVEEAGGNGLIIVAGATASAADAWGFRMRDTVWSVVGCHDMSNGTSTRMTEPKAWLGSMKGLKPVGVGSAEVHAVLWGTVVAYETVLNTDPPSANLGLYDTENS